MISHNITKYESEGKRYAESWIQINVFWKSYVFSVKRIELGSSIL